MTSWVKKSMIIAGSVLVCTGIAVVFDNVSEYAVAESEQVPVDTALAVEETPSEVLYGLVVNDLNVVKSEVKRNQRFTDLINGYNVHPAVFRQLSLVPRSIFDFRKVAAQKNYIVLTERDSAKSLKALIYESGPVDYSVFYFSDTLVIENCSKPVITVDRTVAAEIQSNLSETIESLNISHELTNKFVDVFAWQVDFQRLQKGDKFKLIYRERQVDGITVGIESIEAIYFEHSGSTYYAFPFDQCDGIDYFDENGNSLRKALLKYPIEFTRISSRFNPNRFHPVAKVFRAHKGTDFAAPEGTPIRSAGDGIVEEAQYKSGNGNYVKIRHNGTYTTQYLHMSRIANGIKAGVRVRQGQNIGFVGSTGLANGPHLCYRFWKNGVQVDALKVQLPAAEPVKDAFRSQFEQKRDEMTRRLGEIHFQQTQPAIAEAAI